MKVSQQLTKSRRITVLISRVDCPHHNRATIVELGVIIGKPGRNIAAVNAMSYISGYCLAIDYTARNMQDKVKKAGLPWSAVKGFDTFCPVSDFIDVKQIPDPHDLELWYKVNGVTKQSDRTDLMLYRIPELIRHCSSIMKLEEGDLLLTGQSSSSH